MVQLSAAVLIFDKTRMFFVGSILNKKKTGKAQVFSYFCPLIVCVLYGKLYFTISLGKRFYFYRLCVFYLLVFSLHSLEPGICSAQIISGL